MELCSNKTFCMVSPYPMNGYTKTAVQVKASRIFCSGLGVLFSWLAGFYSAAKPNFLFRGLIRRLTG
jgi:hypothetical protein